MIKLFIKIVIKILPLRIQEVIFRNYCKLFKRETIKLNQHSLSTYLSNSNDELYYSEKNFVKNLTRMSYLITSPDLFKAYVYTYAKRNLIPIRKRSSANISKTSPILICAVKNDLLRVQMQIEHYRKIGIKHFVYIDNISTDGTFEWLNQLDIDLFRTNDQFNSYAKDAWFRQVTDFYGYDRWYLIVDSDELFVYPGMESYSIDKYIQFLEKQKLNRICCFMIDMYSRSNTLYGSRVNNPTASTIKEEYCFFDTSSYKVKKELLGRSIIGGPRTRAFSENLKDFTMPLHKHPLIKLAQDDIFIMHSPFPFYKNRKIPIVAGLLHYKFLPGDQAKYKEIAKNGNYGGGSREYKQYLKIQEEMTEISFFNDQSVEFQSSKDLSKIDIMDRKFFNKLETFYSNS